MFMRRVVDGRDQLRAYVWFLANALNYFVLNYINGLAITFYQNSLYGNNVKGIFKTYCYIIIIKGGKGGGIFSVLYNRIRNRIVDSPAKKSCWLVDGFTGEKRKRTWRTSRRMRKDLSKWNGQN